MTFTDIITEESRPKSADELEERLFVRRMRWGLTGMYMVTLVAGIGIFWAGYFAGAAGWGL